MDFFSNVVAQFTLGALVACALFLVAHRIMKLSKSSSPKAAPAPVDPALEERAGLSFRMPISDVFQIQGRGLIVTGKIEQGTTRIGDALVITGGSAPIPVTVTGIESFNKQQQDARPGQNVGILVGNVKKEDIGDHAVLEAA